jgi:hypothetical protein
MSIAPASIRPTNSAALAGDQIVSDGHDRGPRFRKQCLNLVRDALDAGADRHQAVWLLAFRAQPRRRHHVPQWWQARR